MFKIKWTDEAKENYFETLQFWIIHNKSSTYSEKIISEVEFKESLLANHPYIGNIIEDTEEEVRRILILNNYSLFYRINVSEIEIISFWANKMNPDDLKL